MTRDEVKACLCVNDPRSPHYMTFDKADEFAEPCGYCDPCFSGKSKLAEFTLTLMEDLEMP